MNQDATQSIPCSTERLVIRRAAQSDLPALQALNADEDVMRMIGPTKSSEQTRDWFERILAVTDTHPAGEYEIGGKPARYFTLSREAYLVGREAALASGQ